MAPNRNVLLPAQSGQLVAIKAQDIQIHPEGISKLALEIIESMKSGKIKFPAYGDDEMHPSRDDESAVDWIFVTDALNFCFWTPGDATKWRVNGQTGYYAFTAALRRASKNGVDIANPNVYTKFTELELKELMEGDDRETIIPLLSERVKILKEVGHTLLSKFNGTFVECVKQANKSAVKLVEIVVENFESFRDEAEFDGYTVSFYKRAQILVADLWSCFHGEGLGEFYDIDSITMFADYRVPQVLVHYGVLSYSAALFDLLNKDELLRGGSRQEIEIRGCSIQAVELLKQKVRETINSDTKSILDPNTINSVLIDYFLWCYRREHADELENIPFHKVIGIYY